MCHTSGCMKSYKLYNCHIKDHTETDTQFSLFYVLFVSKVNLYRFFYLCPQHDNLLLTFGSSCINPYHVEYIKMPRPLIFSQSDPGC